VTARVTIDIWSDVMCPWCIIGWKQLEKGLALLGDEVEANFHWHAFELNPDMPREGEDSAEHVQRKYGRTAEQAAAGRAQMNAIAERAGYSFAWSGEGEAPPSRLWNTFDAHKLLAHAFRAHGADAQTRLKLALFDAHFRARRDMADETVLADVYESTGLPRHEAEVAFADPVLGEQVRADEAMAWDRNITGVPAMVINGKYLIAGAQEPEAYADAIRRVLAKEAEAAA
jgi:predicted DsbA family dithiol-disulfide isomerase